MCMYHIYCSRDTQREDCREAEIRYRNDRRKGNKLFVGATLSVFVLSCESDALQIYFHANKRTA